MLIDRGLLNMARTLRCRMLHNGEHKEYESRPGRNGLVVTELVVYECGECGRSLL